MHTDESMQAKIQYNSCNVKWRYHNIYIFWLCNVPWYCRQKGLKLASEVIWFRAPFRFIIHKRKKEVVDFTRHRNHSILLSYHQRFFLGSKKSVAIFVNKMFKNIHNYLKILQLAHKYVCNRYFLHCSVICFQDLCSFWNWAWSRHDFKFHVFFGTGPNRYFEVDPLLIYKTQGIDKNNRINNASGKQLIFFWGHQYRKRSVRIMHGSNGTITLGDKRTKCKMILWSFTLVANTTTWLYSPGNITTKNEYFVNNYFLCAFLWHVTVNLLFF